MNSVRPTGTDSVGTKNIAMRILVAEDVRLSATWLTVGLRKLGHEALVVRDGQEALTRFIIEQPVRASLRTIQIQ